MKIYTTAFRLIREVSYSGSKKDSIVSRGYFSCEPSDLNALADGTYYYYIYAVNNGKEIRSKSDKIIIMK